MLDYYNVIPDKTKLLNKHFTKGRGGHKIEYITRHHLAGIGTTEDVWNWWQTRQASAHYVVENSGQVGQLVWDGDTAWSNANGASNRVSIAIEHSNSTGNPTWSINDTVIREGARLAAALCLFYNLGRPVFGKNIRDHREFGSTSCPHHLANGGKYHKQWMDEAQSFYDKLVDRLVTPTGATIMPADNKEDNMAGVILGGVSAAALNDAKHAALGAEDASAEVRDILKTKNSSIINPNHSFDLETYVVLMDAAVWESRKLMEAVARKLGLDPDQIVEDAILEDRGEL